MKLGKKARTFVSMLLLAAAPAAYGQSSVFINFDDLSLGGGSITGAAVDTYFDAYGITLANLTPGATAYIRDTTFSPWAAVPSAPNVFSISGPTPNGNSFQMVFDGPVSNFTFSRRGNIAEFSPSGSVNGPWSAVAFDAANNMLGSVGEGLISTYATIPVATFTLAYADISYVTFTGNALGFAGTQMPELDDIQFTTAVPEPETYAMLLLGLAAIAFARRRRRA